MRLVLTNSEKGTQKINYRPISLINIVVMGKFLYKILANQIQF